ncbi:lasso peptide biosynthesis B2 protein [Bacillus thuringiensis]|uniref:lasso peptide biosynthesis B2 protein n=1 Tax=Bacillus thuringiensis TaxID=1428 RepID=UPI000CD7E3B3|nr:lasso peptide biosynthesis B2 protein [Bacillus thuringiensis]MCU4930820.1 lasso peptide biosynthesis B2 protein [Bacillus cereus]QFQ28802.1 lasso peptide biosynthesis B2 protein [Bacillus thuringiensis]
MIKYIRIFYETFLVNYYLKKYEFGYVKEMYNKKYGDLKLSKEFDIKEGKALLKKIDKVCFWFFGNAQCLHRSLIGFKLLRQQGLSVQLVVGVKKFPFSSHAWVECDGTVINDVQRVKESYIEVFRIGEAN